MTPRLTPELSLRLCLGLALCLNASCFRTPSYCVLDTDCFGDEVCSQDLSCVPDPSPSRGLEFTPEALTREQLIVSEVFARELYAGECSSALDASGTFWLGYNEHPELDTRIVRRDGQTGARTTYEVGPALDLLSGLDLDVTPEGRALMCAHEWGGEGLFVFDLLAERAELVSRLTITPNSEPTCRVAGVGERAFVLYDESTGQGANTRLMWGTPEDAPRELDAATHDFARPIDLFVDPGGVVQAVYFGRLLDRTSVRYGDVGESSDFETLEGTLPGLQSSARAALDGSGALHFAFVERTISAGEEFFSLRYLNPNDPGLDLSVELYFGSTSFDFDIDPTGRPHLVFTPASEASLVYATVIGGSWAFFDVSSPSMVLIDCLRIHADTRGRAHLLVNKEDEQGESLVYRVFDVQGGR